MRLPSSAALLLLLFAGCLAPAGQEQPPLEETDPGRVVGTSDGTDADEPMAISSGKTVNPVKPTPQRIVFTAQGTTMANAGGWGLDTALGLGIRALDLYVPPEASGVVVEVTWAAPQDLDLEIHAPPSDFHGVSSDPTSWARCYAGLPSPGVWCNGDGHVGSPDGPIVLRLTRSELDFYLSTHCNAAGDEWGDCNVFAVGLRSKDANAALDWTVAATVFIGEEPPADYHVL